MVRYLICNKILKIRDGHQPEQWAYEIKFTFQINQADIIYSPSFRSKSVGLFPPWNTKGEIWWRLFSMQLQRMRTETFKVFFSHKAIVWLQKTWCIVYKSYGLLLWDFYGAVVTFSRLELLSPYSLQLHGKTVFILCCFLGWMKQSFKQNTFPRFSPSLKCMFELF